MSTTDKLHRELDKRGIKWFVTPRGSTSFTSPVLGRVFVWENSDGGFALDAGYAPMTLEQLIAATLGRGTCEADETDVIKCWVKCKHEPSTEHVELIHVMRCSECGGTYEHVNGSYEYCPRCGARIGVRS